MINPGLIEVGDKLKSKTTGTTYIVTLKAGRSIRATVAGHLCLKSVWVNTNNVVLKLTGD